MESQKKPRLIRLSKTPKTNPEKYFCSKSLSTMGAKLVVFQPFTLNKNYFWDWFQGVLESLINRGFFWFSILTSSSVQCNVHPIFSQKCVSHHITFHVMSTRLDKALGLTICLLNNFHQTRYSFTIFFLNTNKKLTYCQQN